MSETPGELFINRNVNDRRYGLLSKAYLDDTYEQINKEADEMLSGNFNTCWNCDSPNVGHEKTGSGQPLCRSCARTVPEHILKAN